MQNGVRQAGIEYRVNPRLVRGLDYYNSTVYEWVTSRLGAQSAVCSGGRYDGLFAQLGGKPTPGCGFGIDTSGYEVSLSLCAITLLGGQLSQPRFTIATGTFSTECAARMANFSSAAARFRRPAFGP